MNADTFLPIFRQALDNIDENFYDREHWIRPRYGERLFCNELYHQVRKLFDLYMTQHPDEIGYIHFQAEVRKVLLSPVDEERLGVKALGGEYSPDFLLHSQIRGDFSRQELIIEVKSRPDLTWSQIQNDIAKIQQFITRYQFQRGLFLAINVSQNRILELLTVARNVRWMQNNLPDADKILVMCKELPNVPLFECNLRDLLLV